MRNQRFAVRALLLACLPILSQAANPEGVASFSRQIRGTEQRVSITSATLADHVYFEMHILADDGEHLLQVTIYDGNGREVFNSEYSFVAKAGGADKALSYGFDTNRDAPGTWWYVASVDDKIALSGSLPVSR